MSRGINKVILIGTLGADPEVRYSPEGKCLASLSLATNERWKDKNTGQDQERTEWHRVVIYGKLAEISGEYLRKGSQVYFEGKLRTRKWTDQQGQDKYTTEVVIDINGQMQMLGGSRDQNSPPGGYTQPRQTQPQAQPQQGTPHRQSAPKPPQPAPAPSMDFDDDIPFNPAPV